MVKECFFNDSSVINRNLPADEQTALQNSLIAQNHLHNYERWFGASPGRTGPGLQNSLTGFRVTTSATANVFGTAILVFDGSETPAQPGMKYFDFRRFQSIDAENANKTYRVRMANSSQGQTSFNAAVAAGVFSDLCFKLTTNPSQAFPFEMWNERLPVGTKVWVAITSADSVSQWVDFIVGIHEYPY